MDCPDNPRYVSWWPHNENDCNKYKKAMNKCESCYSSSPILDCLSEGGQPHVVYHVRGLKEWEMLCEWEKIRTKDCSSYSMGRKNCAGVVIAVLRAGGVEGLLGRTVKDYHNSMFLKPKSVAAIGNELRNRGFATKERNHNCPPKSSSPFAVMLGMR